MIRLMLTRSKIESLVGPQADETRGGRHMYRFEPLGWLRLSALKTDTNASTPDEVRTLRTGIGASCPNEALRGFEPITV